MNNVHYAVKIISDYSIGSTEITHVLKTIEEVKEKVREHESLKSTRSISVMEYRLIYDHENKLPTPDGFNDFFGENVYNEQYTNETPRVVKVNEYIKNIENYSNIFKIHYKVLDERSELQGTEYALQYFKEVNCVYNATSIKEVKERMRAHTKSKRFFEIKLFQCKEINKEDL